MNNTKYFTMETSIGAIELAISQQGLSLLHFSDAAPQLPLPPIKYISIIEGYFAGTSDLSQIKLNMCGTPFQKQVWQALCKIPYGEICSYAEIAVAIKKPMAYRAVANACASNKIAIAIPCHRVIASGGKLGGYRFGIERKRSLLTLEGVIPRL